jgi:hypothetical protein
MTSKPIWRKSALGYLIATLRGTLLADVSEEPPASWQLRGWVVYVPKKAGRPDVPCFARGLEGGDLGKEKAQAVLDSLEYQLLLAELHPKPKGQWIECSEGNIRFAICGADASWGAFISDGERSWAAVEGVYTSPGVAFEVARETAREAAKEKEAT